MAVDRHTIAKALEEVAEGVKTKAQIAEEYGVSKKTLWKWQKNPPGLPTIEKHPKTAKKIQIDENDYDIIDNPVTTEHLLPVDLPDSPDSLLIDQLEDIRETTFIHKYIETKSPMLSYIEAYDEPIKSVASYKGQALLRSRRVSAAMRQINVLQIRTFESQILPDCIAYLSNVLNADIAEFYDDKGKFRDFKDINPEYRRILQEIDFTNGKEKIKLPDKTKAAALLAKVFGMYHESQITLNMTQNNFSVQQQKATEGQAILDNIVNGRDPMAINNN
jgi:hypothetical protein